ncbi:MAG: ABC transporter ATP-binding protein [Candidatus Berkelbacteria bacterium]
MTKLIRFLKPYIWQIVILLILTYLQVMATLALPDYMAKIINNGISGKDIGLVWHDGFWMLGISLAGAACAVGAGYLASKIATGFSRDLRESVFSRIESFSLVEFNKFSTSSLITRSTNDIQQIQMVVIMLLRMVLSAPIMAVGAVFKAYHMAPSMSWIIALAVVVMFGIIGVIFSIAMPKFELLQKLVDKLNLVTRQNLTGLRVVRAFNNETIEEEKFDKVNKDLTDTNLFVNRLMVIMQPLMTLIFNFTTIGIIWYGAKLIGNGTLQIGDMLAFMQYAMQVIMSFLMISIIFIMVPRASVSGKRIAEVIETLPLITDPKNPVKVDGKGIGLVEFKDVTFSYPGAESPVISNISFTAKPGETTAFIGSTGSGKSTIINLIPRFYDVTSGSVSIDGVDVRDFKLEDLYRKIGYVPQRSVLFSGTIKSNITYGNQSATDSEIAKAVKTSQAEDFIGKTEKSLETSIAQAGANISGGQKQRLSIARALVKKPEIYIFDDSFSALDLKTDSALRKALENETKDRTVLIIGQRISTIMNADNIIVFEGGKICGQGRHEQLIKSCEVYREIASSQLSDEELKNIGLSLHEVDKTVMELTQKESV